MYQQLDVASSRLPHVQYEDPAPRALDESVDQPDEVATEDP